MIKPCELYTLIPPEESHRIMSQLYCELTPDFMGFEDVYKGAMLATQSNKEGITIIDFGCNYAPQCYFFKDYKMYIGVDDMELTYPMNNEHIERFKCKNTVHYKSCIQAFIKNTLPALELDLNKCFAICSYVDDEEARRMVREMFPYCLVYYP